MVVERRRAGLSTVDVSGPTADVRLAAALRLINQEVRRPFDLARGAIRFILYRLGAEDHVLFINAHHIVMDGWSLGVFSRELQILYGDLRQNRASTLAEPPLQFGDYAAWQRDWLSGSTLDRYVDHWTQELEGSMPVTSHAGPGATNRVPFAGRSLHLDIGPDLAAPLHRACRETGSTLYMALESLFALTVAWDAGLRDVVVGTSVAKRRAGRLETAIGFFANTLPVRTRLQGDVTFRSLVASTREWLVKAFAVEEVPLESIVARLRRTGALGRDAALFDTFFVLHNEPGQLFTLPEVAGGAARPRESQQHVQARRVGGRTSWRSGVHAALRLERSEPSARGGHGGDVRAAAGGQRRGAGPAGHRHPRRAGSIGRAALPGVRRPGRGASMTDILESPIGNRRPMPAPPLDHAHPRAAPMTYHQERLWFIDAFERGRIYPGPPTYHNIPVWLRIDGRSPWRPWRRP